MFGRSNNAPTGIMLATPDHARLVRPAGRRQIGYGDISMSN